MKLETFVEKFDAEVVAGRVIVGSGADRRFVGDLFDGALELNEEGDRLVAEAAATAKKPAAKKED